MEKTGWEMSSKQICKLPDRGLEAWMRAVEARNSAFRKMEGTQNLKDFTFPNPSIQGSGELSLALDVS